MKKKSILLIVDYSEKIGKGHINRVDTIINSLETKLFSIKRIIANENNFQELETIFKNQNFEKVYFQLILIDSFLISNDTIEKISQYAKQVLIIDDWIGRNLIGENLNILDWTALAENSPIHAEQIHLKSFLGLNYCPLKKIKDRIENKTNDFLIYLGSDISPKIYIEIINHLHRSYKDRNIIVISEEIAKIKNNFINNKKISFLDYLTEEIFKIYLLNSRFFVTIGGWSSYQAIALNCFPLIISLKSTNTYYDCYGMVYLGYGLPLGYIDQNQKFINTHSKLDLKDIYLTSQEIGDGFKSLNKLLK